MLMDVTLKRLEVTFKAAGRHVGSQLILFINGVP